MELCKLHLQSLRNCFSLLRGCSIMLLSKDLTVSFHLKQNFYPESKSIQMDASTSSFDISVSSWYESVLCSNHLRSPSTVCSKAVCSLTACAQVHRGRRYPLHWGRARWSQREGGAPRCCFKVSAVPFEFAFITFGESWLAEGIHSLECRGHDEGDLQRSKCNGWVSIFTHAAS